MDASEGTHRIALLIDVENVAPKFFKSINTYLLKEGKVQIKRAYGDFFA